MKRTLPVASYVKFQRTLKEIDLLIMHPHATTEDKQELWRLRRQLFEIPADEGFEIPADEGA